MAEARPGVMIHVMIHRALPLGEWAAAVAFPGSTERGAGRWVGLALEHLGTDADEAARDYLATIPTSLVDTVALAVRDGFSWAPCSACGEGTLVATSVGAQGGLTPSKGAGPGCRFTPDCKGKHLPLVGPWVEHHPLAAHLVIEAPLPW